MNISPKDLIGPWENSNFPKLKNILIMDRTYHCPTEEYVINHIYPEYLNWLKAQNVSIYDNIKWDCENYARSFKVFSDIYNVSHEEIKANSLAIGIIHYTSRSRAENGTPGKHCANIIYLNYPSPDRFKNYVKPTFFEPQNSKFFEMTREEYNSISFVYV